MNGRAAEDTDLSFREEYQSILAEGKNRATGYERWTATDLGPYLDGTIKPVKPTLGLRSDDVALLYKGKTHSLVGESEAGKTWLALWWTVQVIKDGGSVLYLDFEDSPEGIIERLLTLGLKPVEISESFIYVNPEPGQVFDGAATLRNLDAMYCGLAVIDGVTESVACSGVSQIGNDWNNNYAAWQMDLPAPLARLGCAVLLIDHPVKADKDNPTRYASGAGHKLRGLTGASYVMYSNEPCGRGLVGNSTVYVAKDRPGWVRGYGTFDDKARMTCIGHFTINATGSRTIVSLDDNTSGFRPTGLMAQVSAVTAAEPDRRWSKKQLRDVVHGRAQDVIRAISLLALEGYLKEIPTSDYPCYEHQKLFKEAF